MGVGEDWPLAHRLDDSWSMGRSNACSTETALNNLELISPLDPVALRFRVAGERP